jgi:hypothetical protein
MQLPCFRSRSRISRSFAICTLRLASSTTRPGQTAAMISSFETSSPRRSSSLSADDSPPVFGTFPTSPRDAVSYFFDSTQLGASQSITVDGRTTSVGMSYLVGPIKTLPLQDGGGTHFIAVGVFLTPLSPGTHTVSIGGRFDGALIPIGFLSVGIPDINFVEESFTYTVIVQ